VAYGRVSNITDHLLLFLFLSLSLCWKGTIPRRSQFIALNANTLADLRVRKRKKIFLKIKREEYLTHFFTYVTYCFTQREGEEGWKRVREGQGYVNVYGLWYPMIWCVCVCYMPQLFFSTNITSLSHTHTDTHTTKIFLSLSFSLSLSYTLLFSSLTYGLFLSH